MSGHVEVECWVDREHFDNMTLAADSIGISPSVLCREHKKAEHFLILDEFDHLHTIDFMDPGPAEPPPPPSPPRPRRPGEPLLRGHVTHRLGVYR